MTERTWTAVGEKYQIPARPDGLWTKVCDLVEGPLKLRLEAKGEWEFSKKRCGPDGSVKEGLVTDALVPWAPVGALVGKVGGSTADKPDLARLGVFFVFAVGSYCVVILESTVRGALFLTMNDVMAGFDGHTGAIEVAISEAR